VFTLNDVEIFNGVAANLELDATARDAMRRLIDARDGKELERFLTPHAPAEERCAFARLTQLSGKRETLDKARTVITNKRSVAGLNRLESVWQVVESLGLADHFEIDLGNVSRLDYYTGLTFKVYVAGAGARIGSGGRYDDLAAKFGKSEPAIGFVLDLESLTDVLLARSREPVSTGSLQREALEIKNDDPALLFREAMNRRAEDARVLVKLSEVAS
jgi:ATP phosphoribosyltransferase regulatory subunit